MFISFCCVLVLAQAVLAYENCSNEVVIRKDDTCDSIAKFCQISLDDLLANNDYFEDGQKCTNNNNSSNNNMLAPDTKICCDVVNGTTVDSSDDLPNKDCGGCPNKVSKVCGSDAKTYDSQCELEAALCWDPDSDLRAMFDGDCRKQIADLTCSSSSDCQGRFDPVCGSNGRTYCNRCLINALQCSRGWSLEDLNVKQMGSCPNVGPKSKCDKQCPIVYEPVCGTDDLTYDNKCHLEVESCHNEDKNKDNKKLEILHDGPCLPGVYTSCHPLFHPTPCIRHGPRDPMPVELSNNCIMTRCSGAVNPVCGNDNRTYCNMCYFRNEACANPDLKMDHEGVCTKN